MPLSRLLNFARDLRYFSPVKLRRRKARHLEGISAPVRVYRDLYGIPHIVAESDRDAYIALGHEMAHDRLWQMDFFRHAFLGRLTEIFGDRPLEWRRNLTLFQGKTLLDLDHFMRIVGLRQAAEASLAVTSDAGVRALSWFCEGVNQYVASLPPLYLPAEYRLLRTTPERWHPIDCVAIGKGMALQQEHGWRVMLGMVALLAGAPGKEALIARLWPSDDGTAIMRVANGDAAQRLRDLLTDGQEFIGFQDGPIGSNAWVVGPRKSDLHTATLCNDMHLPLTAPSLLYQFHLKSPETNVIGTTFPGLPIVLAGHNAEIAWGVTSGKCHASDIVVETLRGDQVRTAGGWKALENRQEQYRIKGKGVVTRAVRRTPHGPLLSDAVDTGASSGLSLKWTGLWPTADLDAFLEIGKASDWESYRAAAAKLGAPTIGTVFADRAGNIGYQLVGCVPRRSAPSSPFPRASDDPAVDWGERIPFDALPRLYNPPQRYIATANNRHVTRDYPYDLGDLFEPSYRWQRICQLLEQKAQLGLDDHKAIQLDTRCLHADPIIDTVLRPLLQRADALSKPARRMLTLILQWNRRYDPESVGATAYRVFYQTWMQQSLAATLPGAPTEKLLEAVRLVRLPLEASDVDTFALAPAALDAAEAWCRKQLGRASKHWTWGRLHTVTHHHGLDAVPGLKQLFSLGPKPAPGDSTTVNMGTFSLSDPYAVTLGPAVRMIINLGNFHDSWWVVNTGVSGHVFSKHYNDQEPVWRHGGYLRMHFSDEAVAAMPRRTYLPRR